MPSGNYCGKFKGGRAWEVKVVVASELQYNFSIAMDGSAPFLCGLEQVKYNPTTGIVSLANILSPNDCMNELLVAFGIPPPQVMFQLKYFSSNNFLSLLQSYNGGPYVPLGFYLRTC